MAEVNETLGTEKVALVHKISQLYKVRPRLSRWEGFQFDPS